ncbi:hypothetical protein CB0940_05070 [Cercospora beticola]|uniref:Zn(2)-C6 fungal-type domain-containing protein n=1 Tax=Cercospora beticola TaxID=122368 RepID=A0A2G5HM72_CERBT|nr:hypothetical protein CB0940_05070 [Cercospora beticola]PIA93656.1 hypothetical protein CB0940_05070 [Cercospora beticola]WPB02369.1 hypothetical protein RHO25_007003 [Cercospora beticola]CAK1362746.1 unnamed protein product [Cercospora beticola]
MPTRLAACDPCRASKVSCDHARPVCGRCSKNDESDKCGYRDRPFKRKRLIRPSASATIAVNTTPPVTIVSASPSTSTSTPHVYPNPGYQGRSSHAAIFDTVKASGGSTLPEGVLQEAMLELEDSEKAQHAKFLDDLKRLDLEACAQLIFQWNLRGVTLPIAGPLLTPCTEAVCDLFRDKTGVELASLLFRSSRERLTADGTMSINSFCDTFCRGDPGWATLGLFLVGLSRAVEDTAYHPALYSTRNGQRHLQKTALRCSDQCLDICLSLDCLNDLQLLLQYENFIAHSMIDGDQSYHSWRRLGDVISTIYALGHHDRVDLASLTSQTLAGLRSQTVARSYSADKNISVFLDRPYRMHSAQSALKMSRGDVEGLFHAVPAPQTGQFDYTLETRWTVACALLKERVLDLLRDDDHMSRTQASNVILTECDALMTALPERYRLENHLKDFEGTAIQRDFVASAALNLLHVRFLLHTPSMTRTSVPSHELVMVSGAMLKIAAEVAMLKDSLANSGTGFIWKIASYGLPAAGAICLALVSGAHSFAQNNPSIPQAIQDMNVLVAHMEAGVLIRPDQPNYALLQHATATIKSVLNRHSLGLLSSQHEMSTLAPNEQVSIVEQWPTFGIDNFDFPPDFWANLAEHPALFQDIT